MTVKNILVFGATGNQGRNTVQALAALNEPTQRFQILAVTRDPASDAAKALSAIPGVQVVQADEDDFEPLFKGKDIHGVFSVQGVPNDKEAKQGIQIIDLSVKYGIKHLIYSGIDFAGQAENSSVMPGHFHNKQSIEAHLQTVPPTLGYTILRPTVFYENFYWPLWLASPKAHWPKGIKYKLVGTDDIGKVAASILDKPEGHDRKVYELAGDALTGEEVIELFKEVCGIDILEMEVPDFTIMPFVNATVEFVAKYPYVADPTKTREVFPFVKDFGAWLKTTPMAKGKESVVRMSPDWRSE